MRRLGCLSRVGASVRLSTWGDFPPGSECKLGRWKPSKSQWMALSKRSRASALLLFAMVVRAAHEHTFDLLSSSSSLESLKVHGRAMRQKSNC